MNNRWTMKLVGFLQGRRPYDSWALLLVVVFLFASCSEILSPDITDKSITVNSPVDSLYTGLGVVTFWWEKEDAIEKYEFRITNGSGGNINLVLDTSLIENSLAHAFFQDDVYHWQVRGKNEGSATDWIARDIFIDGTSPDKATAISFNDDTLLVGEIGSLAWYSSDYPLDGAIYPTTDSLYLYRKNDSVTIGAKFYFQENDPRDLPIASTAPSPLNGTGKYYWRVVTIDKAGNRQISDQFHFWVQ